jgi:DNA primase
LISKSTIDKVYDASRVEEVISDFIQLKKSGSNFKGLSPFSKEKTPSFMVSPAKQIWKDFSSGKGGNSVAFLMEHEQFSYPEAIRFLAKKYNIEIEETYKTEKEKEKLSFLESLYLVVQNANENFKNNLWERDEGKAIAMTYLRERGFENEVIKLFDIGYSLNEKSHFSDQALKKGYSKKYLELIGLSINKDNTYIDRFRSRLMFPIKNFSGRVIGFGGRILNNNLKTAKYINSPESDIYHKSKVLYGLYESKKEIVKKDLCIIVEGYTDVIQMHQSGIKNVVASSGTSLSNDQIRLVQRLTSNIIVLFDGDDAGLNASLRGLVTILKNGMNVRVCQLPHGEDPDSFLKSNSKEKTLDYFNNFSKDFIQFKADILSKKSKNDPVKKSQTIFEIVEIISIIPDQIKQQVYIQNCSKIMDISEDILFNTLAQINSKNLTVKNKKNSYGKDKMRVINKSELTDKIDHIYELEFQIIKILLLYGNKDESFVETILKNHDGEELIEEKVELNVKVFEKIFLDLQQDEIELAQESFRNLFKILIKHYQSGESIDLNNLINKLPPDLSNIVSDILMKDELYKLHGWNKKNIFIKDKESNVSQLVVETILSLRKYLIDKKINELQVSIENSSENNKEVLSDVISYSQLKKVVSRKLNRVI